MLYPLIVFKSLNLLYLSEVQSFLYFLTENKGLFNFVILFTFFVISDIISEAYSLLAAVNIAISNRSYLCI